MAIQYILRNKNKNKQTSSSSARSDCDEGYADDYDDDDFKDISLGVLNECDKREKAKLDKYEEFLDKNIKFCGVCFSTGGVAGPNAALLVESIALVRIKNNLEPRRLARYHTMLRLSRAIYAAEAAAFRSTRGAFIAEKARAPRKRKETGGGGNLESVPLSYELSKAAARLNNNNNDDDEDKAPTQWSFFERAAAPGRKSESEEEEEEKEKPAG